MADAAVPIFLGALYRGAIAPPRRPPARARLNRARVHVEVEWLIHLTDSGVVPGVRALTEREKSALRQVVEDFDAAAVGELAETERVTQHDVKAVEYFLRKRLTSTAPAE